AIDMLAGVATPEAEELRGKLAGGVDGLEMLGSDLSDAGGMVHVQGRAGRVCWAVARVRGEWLGVQRLVIPEGVGVMASVVVTVGVQPSGGWSTWGELTAGGGRVEGGAGVMRFEVWW